VSHTFPDCADLRKESWVSRLRVASIAREGSKGYFGVLGHRPRLGKREAERDRSRNGSRKH
jgi:hypothetical protein